jgi:hypothetical protein
MTPREEYQALLPKIKDIEERAGNLRVEEGLANEKREDLIRVIINDEKLLQLTSWVLDWQQEELVLLAEADVRNPKIAALQKLCWNGWHSSFELEDGIDLYFDDSKISIGFQDSSRAPLFIRSSGLVINRKQLHQRELELKKQLCALEKLHAI